MIATMQRREFITLLGGAARIELTRSLAPSPERIRKESGFLPGPGAGGGGNRGLCRASGKDRLPERGCSVQ
jgi:hypothetical protein